jgi:hypothetical protein
MVEPDHVKEQPSHAFAFVAADSDICDGERGRDDLRHTLLAERGQAKRAKQNREPAKRFEFRVCL